MSKSNIVLNFGKIKMRENEIMNSKANITLKNLGWNCENSIESGILKIIS